MPDPEVEVDYSQETPEEGITSDEPTPGEVSEGPEGTTPANDPDYRKMFEDTKKAFTQSQMELAELRGRVDGIAQSTPQEPEQDWLDDYDEDTLRVNPALAKDMIQKHREEVVGVIRARDAYWQDQMESRSPDVMQNYERIQTLKQDPDYQGFTDKQLVVIAKKQAAAEPAPRAPSPPGNGVRRSAEPKKADVKNSALFRAIYGNQFDEGTK